MGIMTEEEADTLDELLTKTTLKVNSAIRGITARNTTDDKKLDDPEVAVSA